MLAPCLFLMVEEQLLSSIHPERKGWQVQSLQERNSILPGEPSGHLL